MANVCEYKILAKGKKNACYALAGALPVFDSCEIEEESGTDNAYEVYIHGYCKWAIDYHTSEFTDPCPVELPEDANEAYAKGRDEYDYYRIEDYSRMFQLDLCCNSADIEDYDPENGPYEFYEHYINGKSQDTDCPEKLRIRCEYGDSDYDY